MDYHTNCGELALLLEQIPENNVGRAHSNRIGIVVPMVSKPDLVIDVIRTAAKSAKA